MRCEAGTRLLKRPSRVRSSRPAVDEERLQSRGRVRSSSKHVQSLPSPQDDSSTRHRPQYGVNNNAADSNPAASGRVRPGVDALRVHSGSCRFSLGDIVDLFKQCNKASCNLFDGRGSCLPSVKNTTPVEHNKSKCNKMICLDSVL